MMTQQEFQTAISPILARWPRGYSGDQLQLIQESVATLTHFDFVRLVKHILGSSRVAPMVPDFRKAIQELGVRPQYQSSPNATPAHHHTQEENFLYHVKENIWADNEFVFIRGEKPGFVIKKDSPNHPLVIEACEVREQRVKEIKTHLTKNTYQKFIDSLARPKEGMSRAFSMEELS